MAKEPMTIGCDPEWGLVKNGGIVSASSVIRANGDNSFGVDGCGRVAELRPAHSTTPEGLVKNIKSVLTEGYASHSHLHDHIWKAGGMVCDEPIGGHIHLGAQKLTQQVYRAKVGNALDKTLAVLCLMVEDGEEALNRRMGSSYGSIGGSSSWREQNWGMEYRVLASWLTHPDEAKAILSLCYLVGKEYDNDEIMEEAASLPAFDTNSYKECDKIGLLYYIPPIIAFIRKLPEYERYAKDMIPLFKLIKDRKNWSCDKNMIDTWSLATKENAKTKRSEVAYI